jgi:hypothetical protein
MLSLSARSGRFRRTYRFHSAGLFRFQVAFKGDAQNAASNSSSVYVRALPAPRQPTTPQGGAGEPGTGGGVSPGGGATAYFRRTP